ncbi:hypothetical protein KPL71_022055 [Citrus sinensis]|uniref:Uncharacterized protein n=1 Tax=Citrus sinensis TaxID=2711 RepID=A0ACB8JMG9_CITSI|nr:hypothetical protein KPL71_022055 [Citrus sinensis]
MPPKKKDKGKAVLKDSESKATSKEPQATPSKEKLLSSAMPIKSWIELVEAHEAQYKTTSSDDQSKLTENLVRDWLSAKGLLQPTITHSKAQQTFLTQISKAQSLLASAKTEEEYFKAMEQLLTSRSKSSVADTSEDEDEDEEPFISLGDENEDDCFGIFSPVKHSYCLLHSRYSEQCQVPEFTVHLKLRYSEQFINFDKDSVEGCKSIPVAILTKPKIDHKVLTMDPLICRTSSFSSSSSGKTSDLKHVVSSEEFIIENFDKAIDCWELPKISKKKIYKTKMLDLLKHDYIIKTEERDITLSEPFETIYLFSEKSLKKLKEKNFKYIHIGLIQVGIKPLTKEGLDTSIIAVLRDGRFISFDDSLLSSIESSLCKGPISFDCYPNITISLKDKNILKSMILQIKTYNYHMIKGFIPVALIFKISYKAMISAFSTQHKYQSKRDETLLLQTDLSKANTVIPKPIQWKDVNLPEEWILEGAAPPAIPKQLEPNTELQNVTQYSDGKVKLSFRRSTSSRFSDKASCSSIPSLERKFTKIPSVINLPFQSIKSQPRFSTSDIPSTSIRSVDYTTSVPHPIYTSNQHVQSQEEKEPSPPTSPTFSAVTENVINVIEKEFELDKTFLHNDFYSDLNKEKRLWFFKHFLNQRKEIQQTYYEFVNFHKIHILFFDWFEIYSSDNNISYPFKESNPITIKKKVPEWKLLDSDRTIESEHPPLRSVTVDHGELPVQIRASPYKIPKPNDSEANLSSIIQQNNFCNTNLNTIGKQLTRIETQIHKSTITVPSISPIPTKSDSDKKLKEPIFKPFQFSKTSQKLVLESKSDFAKAIREQLDRIEAASSSSNKVQIAPDTPQSSKIGVLEQDKMSDQMSITSSDIEAFKEEPIPKANKIHWELALPTVRSPPDLTIDNRPSALNQSRYNASSVYEWNLDGMSEYNILGLLQQMTMAANAYKT